ncbi:hypothetical protein DevBK_11795 [Devosia sp. BK]|uniref:hypothetical protein n=1 Tax=unclassified Devosia TaxID=196773 RepID=UPI00071381ED|nr:MULTISPECIES: hypothetical protein [unclassified Devosia]KQT50253.1 hypothetical protein ASG47_19895 [Devosia sp. Leaf420]MDV3252016.1 hypothetical protein [Devosia sp. BK]
MTNPPMELTDEDLEAITGGTGKMGDREDLSEAHKLAELTSRQPDAEASPPAPKDVQSSMHQFISTMPGLASTDNDALLVGIAMSMRDADLNTQQHKIEADHEVAKLQAQEKHDKLEEAQSKIDEAQDKLRSNSAFDKLGASMEWLGAYFSVVAAAQAQGLGPDKIPQHMNDQFKQALGFDPTDAAALKGFVLENLQTVPESARAQVISQFEAMFSKIMAPQAQAINGVESVVEASRLAAASKRGV